MMYFEAPTITVSPTFLPRSQFHEKLGTYRFGVRYQSESFPIRIADLEEIPFSPNKAVLIKTNAMVVSEDSHTVDVSYVASPMEGVWPDSFSIRLFKRMIRDQEGGSHPLISLVTLGATNLRGEPLDTSVVQHVGGRLIEGEPSSHRLSFLTNVGDDHLDQAVLLFGGRSSMFASFEESKDEVPSLVGRLIGTSDGIATFELDQPEEGWGAWGVNKLPYSLHLGEENPADGGFIISEHVEVHLPRIALPLLFSFEEWARQLEKQADLPRGSLEGDADGDGMDSLIEYALGSDILDREDASRLTPTVAMKEGQRHLDLEFNSRTNTIGLQAEVQHSIDGKKWQTVSADFEVMDRTEVKPDVEHLRVCSKEPLQEGAPVGIFRIAVAR